MFYRSVMYVHLRFQHWESGWGAALSQRPPCSLFMFSNCTSCIPRTSSSTPLPTRSLCFLSLFAAPNGLERPGAPLLSGIIMLGTSQLFIFHWLFGVVFHQPFQWIQLSAALRNQNLLFFLEENHNGGWLVCVRAFQTKKLSQDFETAAFAFSNPLAFSS